MPRPVRIAIDVRLPADRWGGVQQVVQGLASGLSNLDGPEEYLFVGNEDAGDVLDPILGGRARRLVVASGSGRTGLRRAYDAIADQSAAAARVVQSLGARLGRSAVPIPRSDGTIETLGVDLVHFILPQAYLTEVPSLYQVHDLLHLEHPEYFSPFHRLYRQLTYSAFAKQARAIATMTNWGRLQIVKRLGISTARVAVVPWAPVTGFVPTTSRLSGTDLPDRFILYPAQTWPHKNHIRLLEALAVLRDAGTVVPLVCVGRQTDHMPAIERRTRELRLEEQVQFLGYIGAADLESIYRRATALVFPSLFEGWGLPVVEAFALDLPAVCAEDTALPDVAGGAALLFDPADTRDLSGAIARVWTDADLRASLIDRGRGRASELSWDLTARTFRALYRRLASQALSEADEALLATPTLVS